MIGVTILDKEHAWLDYRESERDRLVREAITRLKSRGAQVLIALTHQDLKDDKALVGKFPEIDLVVGGHEHVASLNQVSDTWITKADADAISAVRIDINVCKGGLVTVAPSLIKLGPDSPHPKDLTLEAEIDRSLNELEQALRTSQKGKLEIYGLHDAIAKTRFFLGGGEPAIRGRETALGNFLTDVLRAETETEIAFINGGAIRLNDNIPAGGNLTFYDLEGIFYYDNDLVTFQLTGKQLLDVLRTSVSEADAGHGRFLQISGLRFCYRMDSTASSRVQEQEVWIKRTGGYEPLGLTKVYSVTTLRYLCENGSKEGYKILDGKSVVCQPYKRNGKTCPEDCSTQDPTWRQITENWLQNSEDGITSNVEGRIVRLEPGAGERDSICLSPQV